MNPILVQQMAHHQMDTFDREAEGNRRVTLVMPSAASPVTLRARLSQTTGRLRLVIRSSAA